MEQILRLIGDVALERECAAHTRMLEATCKPWRDGAVPTKIKGADAERAEYKKWHRRVEQIKLALRRYN